MPSRIDQHEPVSGRFWLPGSGEDTSPGRFNITGRWPRAEVLGELTPSLQLIQANQDGSSEWGPAPMGQEDLTIHGHLLGHGPVTLVEAQTRRRRGNLFGGLSEQVLEGRYALVGGHVDEANHLFDKARMRLHNLDDWVRLPGLSMNLAEPTHAVRIDYLPPDPLTVDLPLLEATIEFQPTWSLAQPTFNGASLTTRTWLVWTAHAGRTVDALLNDVVAPMSTLLTILFNEDCPALELQVHDASTDAWMDVYSPALAVAPPSSKAMPVLDLRGFGLAAVAGWTQQFSSLSPLPQLIAGAISDSGKTVQNQLLELAIAGEGLHRRLHVDERRYSPEDVAAGGRFLEALGQQAGLVQTTARCVAEGAGDEADPALFSLHPEIAKMLSQSLQQYLWEPSFPQRLQALVDEVSPAAPGVVGRVSRWKREVVNARNGFAHALETQPAVNDIHGWYILTQSLRWLLSARLLVMAGVAPDVLSGALTEYDAYSNFLRSAHKALPHIYGHETSTG